MLFPREDSAFVDAKQTRDVASRDGIGEEPQSQRSPRDALGDRWPANDDFDFGPLTRSQLERGRVPSTVRTVGVGAYGEPALPYRSSIPVQLSAEQKN